MRMIAESWRQAFAPGIYQKGNKSEYPQGKLPQRPILPNKRPDYVNPGNPLQAEINRKSITLKDLHRVR